MRFRIKLGLLAIVFLSTIAVFQLMACGLRVPSQQLLQCATNEIDGKINVVFGNIWSWLLVTLLIALIYRSGNVLLGIFDTTLKKVKNNLDHKHLKKVSLIPPSFEFGD